jgi:hypothetical protein
MAVDHENAMVRGLVSGRVDLDLLPHDSRDRSITSEPSDFADELYLLDSRNTDIVGVIENAEGKQQPYNDANHHDNVENFLDLSVHRNVGINQPEQYPDDDQCDNESNQ